jgi:hypothetical protein
VDCFVNSQRVGAVVDQVTAEKDRLGIEAVWLQPTCAAPKYCSARRRLQEAETVLNDTWYSRDLPVLTAIAENLVPFPARPKILGNLLVVSEHSISSEKDLTAGQANSILSLGSSLVHLYSGRIELPSGGIDLPDEQWKSGSGDENANNCRDPTSFLKFQNQQLQPPSGSLDRDEQRFVASRGDDPTDPDGHRRGLQAAHGSIADS